jgi:hypothetical protein
VAVVAAVLLSMAASVVVVDSYDSVHVQGNTLLTQSGAPVRLLGVDRSGAECSKVAPVAHQVPVIAGEIGVQSVSSGVVVRQATHAY